MEKKAVSGITLTFLLVSMLTSAINIQPVSAEPTKVFVDYHGSPNIIDPTLVPGTQFSINITVDYVEEPWGYQFLMLFNPDVLHGVSVENGPFLESAGGTVEVFPGRGFDNEQGWLYLFIAGLFPIRHFPTGGGTLASVTFEVVGTGESPITLGAETALINMTGGYQFDGEWCYGWYPGPIEWEPYQPWRESLGHGFFSNMPGPELYVRTRGAHGTSGSWPEWTVGSTGDTQTLYCRIMNYGFMGADVKVEFRVRRDSGEFTPWMSNEAEIGPATMVGEELIPTSVTVSASFTVDAEGQYRVCVILYFKAGGMTNFAPYFMVEEALGGEGISRDIPVSFKAV